jgi:hypothetical protein
MGPVLDISGLEEMLDQAQKPVIMQALPEDGEEELWVDCIERAHMFIPLSITHILS